MQSQIQRRQQIFRKSPREWHHHHLLLILSMFGSAVLFLFVLVAYFATRDVGESLNVSKYFAYSTVLLLLSSYPVSQLSFSFDKERGKQIIKNLAIAVFSGLLFTILQLAGWSEMNAQGISLDTRAGSFLVVLSGLHLLHVVVVVLITTIIMYKATAKFSNPISSLIYYTNPYQRLVLQMLSQAWIFLHAVWVVIYLTFITFAG